ncbi:unnamed protein product, partial [Rotaria magnacalcarata]
MDSQYWWCFIVYLINIFLNSIETRYLFTTVKQQNESTNKNQISTKSIYSILQYQSTMPPFLAENSTEIRSNDIIQSFVTRPNSYLYNLETDDEMLLNRAKRDNVPFVCKIDGYFPDRSNCRIYHICTSGVDTAAVCAEGTAWDPVKKNCGWENTVECKKGLRKWDQITDIRGGEEKKM